MIRKIIKIDEERCNGCGLCAAACHENVIAMVDGKAKLIRDDYCDGLGDCLPACPTGAITFEEREAAPYDEAAVKARMKVNADAGPHPSNPLPCGCPGSSAKTFSRDVRPEGSTREPQQNTEPSNSAHCDSLLAQWPVQIKLIPVNAPYFKNARLLIAADCAAYSYGDFHRRFMKDHITLIGCPKLDEGDYSDKLTEILAQNDIKSVTVVRMEVPCCGGIERAAVEALKSCEKMIPWQVITLSTDGRIIDER